MTIDILAKNLLILASAGSGKTYQLGNRVIGIVASGVEPERIVALTFTRKAAGEFADSVVNKLAKAAVDPAAAAALRGAVGLAEEVDFGEVLERVVKALPRFTLGTMDSFFSRIVRGFQYELGLTGGRFDLLEGPRADAARDEILADILGEALDGPAGEEFLHAFRRATPGKENLQIQDPLRRFLKTWHGLYRDARTLEWGPDALAGIPVDEWEKNKHAWIDQARRGTAELEFSDKRQPDALAKALAAFASHTIGSGILGDAGGLVPKLIEAAADTGPLTLKHYKEFTITGPCNEALSELIALAAGCELAAAVGRTRAIRDVVAAYDALCETRLRMNGRLGFDDVKELMGAWAGGEDARLRREAVDFRLDARYGHWLLDEFQDTSGADWRGLQPLIDEAAAAEDGSMFVVGDQKQAIYGWRGGDVRLFDEVRERYGSHGNQLTIAPMADSWRSCPEVLELVNTVCGDLPTMRRLFGGEAAGRWDWTPHTPASHLTRPDKCGEARVERMDEGGWEERLVPLLKEIGVGERDMSCGVLVRSNSQVREVADHLRAAGLDVVEDGHRKPAEDGPVGIAIAHLLRWLAEPSDRFSRGVVAMSPFDPLLLQRHGESWFARWDGLLRRASELGFSGMVGELVEALRDDWSPFGRQRGADVVAALAAFDASGAVTAREAADWIERLEISQSPGAAAVQVMTIHKSKGLGFDVVVIPEVPTDSVPQTQYFDVAQGPGWLTAVPPVWTRKLVPELAAAEERWRADQRYEGFCMLYVALTRAKRGLYVLLKALPKRPDTDAPSLSNWLAESIGDSAGETGIIYQKGDPSWVEHVPLQNRAPAVPGLPLLAAAVPRRERGTPSGAKQGGSIRRSAGGLRFGREVHAAFEAVGWIDEEPPGLAGPPGSAAAMVTEFIGRSAIDALFERRGRNIALFREQPVEAILDGKWLSGIIDRLHLHHDADGRVTRAVVIDFKTDAVDSPDALLERYGGQMAAYRAAMHLAYPTAEVECLLLSTATGGIVAAP